MHFLVIDEDIHPSGLEVLRRAGTVEVIPSTTSEDQVLARLPNVDGILLRKGKMTGRLIDGAPQLKIVARHGVGVDSVDLEAIARRNIILTTTGAANAAAVAEYAFALILSLARHVPAASHDLRSGRWTPTRYLGIQLDQRVLGVVGFGQIGKLVCRCAQGFGMTTLVADPFVDAATVEASGASKVEYAGLLSRADFITYHVRLNDSTRGMFSAGHLRDVKPSVRIINTSRGGICDEDALLEGLTSAVIAGVALDTFAQEPLPEDHPLRAHPNAILTPHIAGQTDEAMRQMAMTAAQSIVDCVEGRTPKYIYQGAPA